MCWERGNGTQSASGNVWDLTLWPSQPFMITPGVVDGTFLPRHPRELLASADFQPVPSIIGVNNDEYGWLIPSVRPSPKLPGAGGPQGWWGQGSGHQSSRPSLPSTGDSPTAQTMKIPDTRKEMDRETVKSILQQVSPTLVRLLGSCPDGGGLLSCPEAREHPAPRYLVHAVSPTSKGWGHRRAQPLPPVPYTSPESISADLTLLPPCCCQPA